MVTSLPLNNNDDPLDSVDNLKSKQSKKSHTASYEKNNATVTSHKKNQDTVTSVVDNQTIDDILNSFDNSIEPNHNNEDVSYNSEIEETKSSQSHIRLRAIISDNFNSTLISAPLRPSVTRAMSIHTTSILNDDFIPFNRPASHSLISASSGLLQALNSDNSFMLNTSNIPSAFREITIYQLFVDGSLFTSQLLPITSQPAIQDNKIKAGYDFLEELKCLFLRVRNPHKNAIEELVRQIIKCNLNSADGTSTLSKKKEMDELKAENSLFYLCQFIKKAFIVNYIARDPEKTKTLDSIMKNIVVPSQIRKNFANNLHL
ncbi:6712_t:CDS:2 [Cetraspora pellucida]|uniref:6712_t:CDS:1 n=1 Tax=Cetraspora pellucida TaxID=1433469 RepID=A0A9N9FTJ9_9GLOM|nr:6712_t:CDS:2 [Cetraspora pellucida]